MSADSAQITVVGAGAIGGWIAASLARAGRQVTALARGPALAALASRGVLLTEDGRTDRVAIRACGDAEAIGPQDLVILAVKAPALADAAEAARPMIGPSTLILPMVNGVPRWFVNGEPLRSVDPEGRIAAALPQPQLLGCVVHAACHCPEPGSVVVDHSDTLIVGEPDGGTSDRAEALRALFEASGITCRVSAAVRQAIWYKLWGNATINPMSALTLATADRLLADPALRSYMLEAMAELASIGAAIGCPIEESGEDRMAVTARLGAFKPSMLQDVEAGRAIELEALLGAPIEIARREGLATPRLDLLYAMVRQFDRARGSS